MSFRAKGIENDNPFDRIKLRKGVVKDTEYGTVNGNIHGERKGEQHETKAHNSKWSDYSNIDNSMHGGF